MPIAVTCPGCKARFTVSDQFAGKKGPCPKCKVVIAIPASSAAAGSNGSSAASPANKAAQGAARKPAAGAGQKATAPGAPPANKAGGAAASKPAGPAAAKPAAGAPPSKAPSAKGPAAAPAGKPPAPGAKGAQPAKGAAPAAPPGTAEPAPPVEVKIHAPQEYATGGRGKGGKAISKPILRKETKIGQMTWIIGIAASVVIVIVALVLRGVVPQNPLPYVVIGLLIVTPPLVRLGYGFLRDDELEAYTGRSLWIRTAICTAVYIGIWALYGFVLVPFGLTGEMWQWFFVGPLLVAIGALVAFAVFDLEPGSAALHVGFFLLVTIVLGLLAGLPPLWQAALQSMA